jgi:hypothetical protein
MPRIGYQDGSDRSDWYTVERLLRKYASIYGIKVFVYVPHTLLSSPLCLPTHALQTNSLQFFAGIITADLPET